MNKHHPEAEDWNASYEFGRPPWDRDALPLALVDLLNTLQPARLKVLVPCAGLGNDAIAWAEAGHDVVAVERERAGRPSPIPRGNVVDQEPGRGVEPQHLLIQFVGDIENPRVVYGDG